MTVKVAPAIVSVPLRVSVVVFVATVKPTAPVPRPLAPDVTLSHVALLAAVHAQLISAVTLTLPVPPAATIDWLVGLIAYEHTAASWLTVTVAPAIVNVPVRASAVVFDATLKPTVPLSLPLAPDVTLNHVALLAAVHAQPVVVVTEMVPDVAPAGAVIEVGDTVKLHAEASLTTKMRPPIVRKPLRANEEVFAAALKATVPLPVPLAPDVTVNHVVPLVAVHAQPAWAVTPTVPGPPAAAIDWLVGLIAYEHVPASWLTVKV